MVKITPQQSAFPMNRHPSLLTLGLALMLLAACAQQGGQPQAPQESPSQKPPAPQAQPQDQPEPAEQKSVSPEPKTRAFPRETLYALLAAELAGSRKQFDIALSNYLQQAHQTRDPQVAARATHIARFLNAESAALDAALLWVEVDPDNAEAQLNAASALIQSGRLQEAFELSRKLYQRGDQALFQNIAARAAEATDTQREQLLTSFMELLDKHPRHPELLVGAGLLMQQQERQEEALTMVQLALQHHPDNSAAIILEASLLHQMGRSNEALGKIAQAVERQPDHLRLRLQYARMLTEQDLAQAQRQFQILVDQEPGDPDLLLSLGIVALERGDTDTARESFEALLDLGAKRSTAHFYLGQLARQHNQTQEALLHFLRVEPGSDFLQATLNILSLLIGEGKLDAAHDHMNRLRSHFPDQGASLYQLESQALLQGNFEDEAMALLDQALASHPNQEDLLYTRAMLHDQRDDLAAAEADLRQLLKYNPNSAQGLNALGYILADQTNRYDEAYDLIRQALDLAPENPAILDSMGWVLYRMGRPEEALPYLEQAMESFPDQEIAAHLGELLWVLGQQERARDTWRWGLEEDPDSELIPATVERLEAGPLDTRP